MLMNDKIMFDRYYCINSTKKTPSKQGWKNPGIYEYFPSRWELLVNRGIYLGNTGYSGKFNFHNQKVFLSKLGLKASNNSVTITSDLKWNSHIRNVSSKANRTLGFLRRNLFSCPQDVKEAAYKSMVRPILEYGSTVWDPHCNGLNDELENVQKCAARFVTRNYSYETGSMTGILEELLWETLQKRRKDNKLILLYKGLKGKARIPTADLIPKNRCCRNQHSLVFGLEISEIPTASKDAYKKSFFPQTIRDWNVLPDSLISSDELSDDCVS